MSMARRNEEEPRRVLMSVDGHEEPEFVIEHALGAVKKHLFRFVENTVYANKAAAQWKEVRKKRADRNFSGKSSSRRSRLPEPKDEDARALLKDIRDMPGIFLPAFTEKFSGDATCAKDLMGKISLSFIDLCNDAVHGKRVSVAGAADAVDTLAFLARTIGADVEALHLDGSLKTLRERAAWENSRSAPAYNPVGGGVTCVGVHWIQPRRVIPGSWWIVALLPGQDAAVEVKVDLTSGEVVKYLLELKLSGPVVAGLAFCFSAPEWFVEKHHRGSVENLWLWAKEKAGHDDRDTIHDDLPKPFRYVKKDEPIRSLQNPGEEAFFRETEKAIFNELRVEPASIFDIGGEGSVGALAIKGMRILADLREGGARAAAIWPMDEPLLVDGLTCVEIFPRSVWTSVYPAESPRSKKNVMRRWNFIADRRNEGVDLGDRAAELATDERAFDALLTAWALRRHVGALKPVLDDRTASVEGRIWVPSEGRGGRGTARRA